jgi:hypothetical protein
MRRSQLQTVCTPDNVICPVTLQVFAPPAHGHCRINDGQDVEEAAQFKIDVVHLRIAPLDVHQHVAPLEIAGRRIELVLLFDRGVDAVAH